MHSFFRLSSDIDKMGSQTEDFLPVENTCDYFSVDQYNCLPTEKSDFKIFHQNIRSFNRNFDELSGFLNSLSSDIDVLILTETWFSESLISDVDGYDGFHVRRSAGHGGGVSIYVKSSIPAQAVPDKSYVLEWVECCTVSISSDFCSQLLITGIYRPPSKSIDSFLNTLTNDILQDSRGKQVLLCGDLNLDLSADTIVSKTFIETLYSFSFSPLIVLPTRVTNECSSCIDHIWYNQCNITTVSGVFQTSITDHYTIFTRLKFTPKEKCNRIAFRDHSEQSLLLLKESFYTLFEHFNLSDDAISVNSRTEKFLECLWNLYDSCCPIRNKSISNKRLTKPWLSDSLLRSIKTKHNLYKQFKNGTVNFNIYNNYKNYLTKTLRKAKVDYYHSKFNQNRGNIKKTWREINSLIRCRKQTPDVVLRDHQGEVQTDKRKVADIFCEYFSSVAADLDSKIPSTDAGPLDFMSFNNNVSFFAVPSTPTEVLNIIKSFSNKSSNINDIPIFIYKHLASELSPIISLLFNHSVTSGSFPDCLKLATIIPIFKSLDRQLPNNYRPISMIHVLSKIFEKLMINRMWNFIDQHNIISHHQFGFRKGRGTADAVMEFVDECVSAMDDKRHVVAVMLDLKKAFDTVNHRVLLRKLERIGFRGIVLDWFRSYLTDRRIDVCVGGVKSGGKKVNIGLPQGNVCSPLLFLLYINDMFKASGAASCLHFADDTTLYLSGDDVAVLCSEMSSSLQVVSKWLSANRLSLNVQKTNYMIFSHNSFSDFTFNVNINGSLLRKVHSCNFLGIKIDDKLRFNEHISTVCSKMSKAVGVMFRLSVIVPPYILKTLYHSILYPHLIYGIIVWGNCGIVNINRVNRIHRRAVRLIEVSNYTPEAHPCSLLSVKSIINYFTALKFHKCIYAINHSYFSNKINNLLPIHTHITRFTVHELYNIPMYKKSLAHNFFLYNSVIFWNSLPSTIKLNNNLREFKLELKMYLLNNVIC